MEGSKGESGGQSSRKGSKESVRGSQVVRNLFCYLEEDPEIRGQISDVDEMDCLNLLKAMELEEYNNGMDADILDSEVVDQDLVEQETLSLPEEWTYSCLDQAVGRTSHKMGGPSSHKSTEVLQEEQAHSETHVEEEPKVTENQSQYSSKSQDQVPPPKAKKKKVWGPIQPERRSKRQAQDGVPILERAQALRMKNDLEIPRGITHFSCHLSSQNLSDLGSKISIAIEDVENSKETCVDSILDNNARRSKEFRASCSFADCTKHMGVEKTSSLASSSREAQGNSKATEGTSVILDHLVDTHTTEGSVNYRNVESNVLEEDPSTPVRNNLGDNRYGDLADLIEEAWTKVASRKKYKKKRK